MIFNIKKWVEQKEIYSSLNKFISLAFMSLKVSISPDTCNGVSDWLPCLKILIRAQRVSWPSLFPFSVQMQLAVLVGIRRERRTSLNMHGKVSLIISSSRNICSRSFSVSLFLQLKHSSSNSLSNNVTYWWNEYKKSMQLLTVIVNTPPTNKYTKCKTNCKHKTCNKYQRKQNSKQQIFELGCYL